MTAFTTVIDTTLPLFILILIGFIIGKIKKVDIQNFIDFVIYIASPFIIFTSIVDSTINISEFNIIILAASLIYIVTIIIAYVGLWLTKSKKNELLIPMVIGNTGYVGFPVALFAFGIEGLSRAVVFNIMSGIFMFSWGVYVFNKKNEIKEIFKLPLIYAIGVALIINFFQISIPKLIFTPIEMIGMTTIPLSLLILGYKLNEFKITSLPIAISSSLFKFIIGFGIAVMIVKIFSITGIVKDIIILQSIMPAAFNSITLSEKYKRDTPLLSSVVLLSTLMSLVVIPVVLFVLPLI